MLSRNSKFAGFTLVELMVVILLVAIMSVYAASRFTGKSHFSVYAAREQAISIIRQIQLGRMQSNLDLDFPGAQVPDRYVLAISSDGTCLSAKNSPCLDSNPKSNFVFIEESDFSFSPTNVALSFDLLGRPSCENVLGCTSANDGTGYKFQISNAIDSLDICINQEGLVNDCL
ncbi:type II secretion system protein [Vibrio sp. SCSIO 43136]|uniref:pilus assembly FimT family protein n=1 Tax=Vibrio sp. SCSIO 43136 TaxID=2819101 RepID=UPI00207545E1|nr:type II secretion system protein [Vibrio sp. SCSIO 43136]USD65015.1 type II secretion system protein [Vibrio sp. SCSIO 43136]